MATLKDNLFNAVRFHYQLTPKDDKGGKKEDQLRVATVLKKVLEMDDQKVSPEAKERAKWWCNQRASNPQVRQMFLNSTDASIEAFLLLPKEQQESELTNVAMPMLNRMVQWVKALQPELSPETLALLEQRLGSRRHAVGRIDLIWIVIALMVIAMILKA